MTNPLQQRNPLHAHPRKTTSSTSPPAHYESAKNAHNAKPGSIQTDPASSAEYQPHPASTRPEPDHDPPQTTHLRPRRTLARHPRNPLRPRRPTPRTADQPIPPQMPRLPCRTPPTLHTASPRRQATNPRLPRQPMHTTRPGETRCLTSPNPPRQQSKPKTSATPPPHTPCNPHS